MIEYVESAVVVGKYTEGDYYVIGIDDHPDDETRFMWKIVPAVPMNIDILEPGITPVYNFPEYREGGGVIGVQPFVIQVLKPVVFDVDTPVEDEDEEWTHIFSREEADYNNKENENAIQ